MKLVLNTAKQGKTISLIRLCAEQGGYMVVANQREAYRVAQLARDMELSIPFPLTFEEFLRGAYNSKGCEPLWIDNADELIQSLSYGTRIGAISLRVGVDE